jgi:hypothetical protein
MVTPSEFGIPCGSRHSESATRSAAPLPYPYGGQGLRRWLCVPPFRVVCLFRASLNQKLIFCEKNLKEHSMALLRLLHFSFANAVPEGTKIQKNDKTLWFIWRILDIRNKSSTISIHQDRIQNQTVVSFFIQFYTFRILPESLSLESADVSCFCGAITLLN